MNEFTIGLRLIKVRQHMGLTQEQVAEKAQLNLNDYIAMEEGKMLKSKEKLEKACKALGIKIDKLSDSHTFINYGENNGVFYNNGGSNTFNQCSNDDNVSMGNTSEDLKHVTELSNYINDNIITLYENQDDIIFKKRLIEILKNYNKRKKRKIIPFM